MPKNQSITSATQTSTNNPAPYIVSNLPQTLVVIAVVLFLVFGWMGWQSVYNNPRRVFQGMLRNNFSTTSVVRTSKTTSQGTTTKVEQLDFVPPIAVHTLTDIEQSSAASGTNKVETETIGTLAEDFSRYNSIQTTEKGANGKTLNYSSVEKIWGKASISDGPVQYFSEANLGLIPFGNLNGSQRQAVMKTITDKKVYDVDYSKVKPKKLNGKSALVFPVKISVAAYIDVLQQLAILQGTHTASDLDPSSYKDQPPIEVTLTVDKLSRQLLQADYSGQSETYSGYGLTTAVALPQKTIPVTQLQQKVQNVK